MDKKFYDYLLTEDVKRMKVSTSLQLLPQLTLDKGIKKYFLQKIPLKYIRIISQMRLLNRFLTRFSIIRKLYKLNVEGLCEGCGRQSVDLSYYTLIEWHLHCEKRNKFIIDCVDETSIISAFLNIVDSSDIKKLKNIYVFIKSVMQNINSRQQKLYVKTK